MAELLGTHEWRDGRLKLGVFPANKNDFPMWGRIKLIRDAVAEGKALSVDQVLALDSRREMSTDHYAWTWALAAILEGDPRYRERFRKLSDEIPRKADITNLFKSMFPLELRWDWQTFVSQLDYGGYDFARMAIVWAAEPPLVFDADRGWHATGRELSKGKTYRITASGRYQIAVGDESWMCEPGGVTIEYYDGKPLGVLLGAFAERGINEDGSLARPITIGLGTTITPDRDGHLYLRVNEAPSGLADNRGELTVRIDEVDRKLAPGQ
jgi:hypothetical protein